MQCKGVVPCGPYCTRDGSIGIRFYGVANGMLGFVWKGRAYEVLAPAGQPVWLWCDGFMNARRIHTKETGGEDGNG